MADAPYTKYRNYQFNGPSDSSDYNSMVEEHYKDLVVLYNWMNQLSEDTQSTARNGIKDLVGLARKLNDIEARLKALESENPSWFITFNGSNETIVENDRFDATAFAIADIDRLSDSRDYPGLFLPPAGSTSAFQSALTFNADQPLVPDSVEVNVMGHTGSADTVGSVVETTQPELSFGRLSGPIWERNIVTNSVDPDGAIMSLYVSVPPDVSPNARCNYVWLDPSPMYSTDILEVAVSTKTTPILEDTDNYIPLNENELNNGDTESIGIMAPGGWDGDEDLLAGKRLWIFDPREVTALKITFRQRNYIVEASSYVYTYGASFLDIGYLKVLDSGRAIVRFDAPEGETISSVDNVIPKIYNLSAAYLPDVFSYRVIWETAEDSGVYTLDPVEMSTRVWVEITLNKAADGTIPLLSGIELDAS